MTMTSTRSSSVSKKCRNEHVWLRVLFHHVIECIRCMVSLELCITPKRGPRESPLTSMKRDAGIKRKGAAVLFQLGNGSLGLLERNQLFDCNVQSHGFTSTLDRLIPRSNVDGSVGLLVLADNWNKDSANKTRHTWLALTRENK